MARPEYRGTAAPVGHVSLPSGSHLARQREALAAATRQLAPHANQTSFSDDALQTAALELLASLPDKPEYCCPPCGPPTVDAARGLLYARARSRRIDEHRAAQRAPIVPLEELDATATPSDSRWISDELIDSFAAREWRRSVDAVIPDNHRDGWLAWQVKSGLGLDAPQMADGLRMSPAAVRQRLSRCAAWVRVNAPVAAEA